MDNSEYTAFSSFRNAGVSGAETFNSWRKKTNGIIVYLDELNADFDDITIGINENNQLFVKDLGIAPAKLSTGAPVWNAAGNVGVGKAAGSKALEVNGSIEATTFFGALSNSLTAGSYLTSTGVFDGSTARTFAVDAVTAATANKIALRGNDGTLIAASPTDATHLATKAYVDGIAEDSNTIIGLSLFL